MSVWSVTTVRQRRRRARRMERGRARGSPGV